MILILSECLSSALSISSMLISRTAYAMQVITADYNMIGESLITRTADPGKRSLQTALRAESEAICVHGSVV